MWKYWAGRVLFWPREIWPCKTNFAEIMTDDDDVMLLSFQIRTQILKRVSVKNLFWIKGQKIAFEAHIFFSLVLLPSDKFPSWTNEINQTDTNLVERNHMFSRIRCYICDLSALFCCSIYPSTQRLAWPLSCLPTWHHPLAALGPVTWFLGAVLRLLPWGACDVFRCLHTQLILPPSHFT